MSWLVTSKLKQLAASYLCAAALHATMSMQACSSEELESVILEDMVLPVSSEPTLTVVHMGHCASCPASTTITSVAGAAHR
jgi:hypothetical protein